MMNRIKFLLLAFGMLITAGGADWPRFQGADGRGVVTLSTPPLRWTAKEGVKWQAPLPGPGSSSPIVYGDRVFVTCYTGYGVDPANPGSIENLKRHLVCYHRNTGEKLWTADVPAVTPEDAFRGYIMEHGYASSTPIVDADAVYCFFGKSGLWAFDHQGKKLWSHSVGTDSDIRKWGSSASPLLFQDVVIVNASSEDRAVYGLDRKTGKQLWRAGGSKLSLSFSTPALVKAGDRTDVVVAMPGEVWGLNPLTGKLMWHATIAPSGNVCPAVIAGEGIAYITGGFQTKGTLAIKAGGSGDVTATHLLWSIKKSSYVPTPILHNGRLVVVNEDGTAWSVKTDTGAVVYEERLSIKGPGGASRPFYASPVQAQQHIYAVSRRGGVYVLAAGDTFGQSHVNPPLDDSDFNASPAIAGNELFLRSNKCLYCIAGS